MKMIMAVIKPHKVDAVREAIAGVGVTGMTLTEVKGFGRQLGHTEIYRGTEYQVNYVPKAKLEIAVSEDRVEPVISAIRQAANEGKIGDGKIFVYDLDAAVRVRTGETADQAL